MLENCIGKTVTALRAYGVDKFDFVATFDSEDFDVGEFGYVVFEFADVHFYISTDGITQKQPYRPKAKELPVSASVSKTFLGAVLQSAFVEEGTYYLQFEGLEQLTGHFSFERGYTDRNYFCLDFPWF